MTCFAHVIPFDKLYHLFDAVLVGPDYPCLFVSLAILTQMKDSILEGDFNSIMQMFSELDLDVEDCIWTLFQAANMTPPSMLSSLSSLNVSSRNKEPMRKKTVPRISLCDFLTMQKYSLVLDVRGVQEFSSAHLKSSLSFGTQDMKALMLFLKLNSSRFSFVVLWSSDESKAAKIARKLIQAKVSRICVLSATEESLMHAKQLCTCLTIKNSLNLVTCSG